jgi:hypothetical protein
MSAASTRPPLGALGVFAWLPLAAILGLTALILVDTGFRGDDTTFLLALLVRWKVFLGVVALRLACGIVLAIHASRSHRVVGSERTIWVIRLVFFTELRAPQYWLELRETASS